MENSDGVMEENKICTSNLRETCFENILEGDLLLFSSDVHPKQLLSNKQYLTKLKNT